MERIEKQFYTTRDIANMFGVTPLSVRIWINKGKLPATKIGDHWYIAKKVLKSMTKDAFSDLDED